MKLYLSPSTQEHNVGAGSYGRHGGGGLSVGIPTQQKRAAGVAIWVPPGAAR